MYCRQLRVSHSAYFSLEGPLLIASNHPNSFLDAIVFSVLFKRPVHSLARGDAFKNKWLASILRSLNMLPVYRSSEGVQNMDYNYSTFDKCKEIFKNKGIVLIFSEGRCINEWHLRSLKKGTARLALSSWQDGIDLTVLPTGVNYQSFSVFGKNIHINFGSEIKKEEMGEEMGFGKSLLFFNQKLQAQLEPLVYELNKEDKGTLAQTFEMHVPAYQKLLLFMPAFIGYCCHLPLYLPLKMIAKKYGHKNDHYDSILFGLLFTCYPFYLLLGGVLINEFTEGSWWMIILLLPFCAWSFMRLKKQF
ncbi:MAG: 1-acyl-sn-glycerol-3-phosphate acyltransferase [Gloeobacteraceae cyanobacterium ES-bin-316]|nr:1-acyl-sn-glycerol-3-phosphate acyltransferase [Ferruginibacter sp.]